MNLDDMSKDDAQILLDALTTPKQAAIDAGRKIKALTEAVVLLTEAVSDLRREIARRAGE